MKPFALILGLLLAAQPLLAGPLERLSEQMARTEAFAARFEQTSYNALKDRAASLSGKLAWMRPGMMRFEYEAPEPLSVIVGKDRVWIFDPLLENVTLADKSEVDRLAGLAFLFSDARLETLYEPLKTPTRRARGEGGSGWVYLRPKRPTAGLVELHVKPGGALVASFILFDAQGNWRRFDLSKAQKHPQLTAEHFRFEIPEGMEVIDKLTVEH